MPTDDELLKELNAAHQDDQIAYARHLCELYLEKRPDHVPTLIAYACNLISLAQYSLARRALEQARSFARKNHLHLVMAQWGHMLEHQGDFLGASEMFMQAHTLRPKDATYLIFAGSVAFRRGDIVLAQKLARKATECSEGSIDEAWFSLGGYLLSACQYQEAANCYRKALEIDPDYQIAKKRLADVELILGREEN